MRNISPAYLYGRASVALRRLKGDSFSSLNEDNIIDWLTGYKKLGTYIDIGANHPDHNNNTKLFYDRGWRGINIEPDKAGYLLFEDTRPDDINLNTGVGTGEMVYFEGASTAAGNTFNEEEAEKRNLRAGQKIKLMPLSEIFKANKLTSVDFISIDVEKFEDNVLESNDWNKYKADVLCIEGFSYPYLEQFGYKRVFWDGGNSYYKLIKRND